MLADQESLQDVTEVLQEVPAVSNLHRIRCTLPPAVGVVLATIPAQNLDSRMVPQPPSQRLGGPIREQVDGLVSFEVHQDRAIAATSPLRPVIDAENVDRLVSAYRLAADEPKEMRWTGSHRESVRKPTPCFPAQRKADLTEGSGQATSSSAAGSDQIQETLTKDATRTPAIAAEEATSVHMEDERKAAAGQVMHRAHVAAVDAPRASSAERARSSTSSRGDREKQLAVSRGYVHQVKGGKVREQRGGVHAEAPEVGCLVLRLAHHHEGGRASFRDR
jgi:hypothetical protein